MAEDDVAYAPTDPYPDSATAYAPTEVQHPDYEYAPTAIVNTHEQAETAPAAIEKQPQEQAPTVIDTYPECAGGTGMVHTVDKMSDGSYKSHNDDHFQAGVCGDSSNQSAPQQAAPQQANQPQSTPPPTVVRTYSECAGGVGRVHDVDQMSDGTYRSYNEHTQSGACGDDGRDRDGASVMRTYSECANTGPGRVHDVEQLSNGGYRTSNEHFQAGVCGDTSNQATPTPMPITSPRISYTTDYRCEGTSQVYYFFYSDGRMQPTGQRDDRSERCGYQQQDRNNNRFYVASNTQNTQFPALSASCNATPFSSTTGQPITWRVFVNGGSGSFNYQWSGDPMLNGQTGSSVVAMYSEAGTKTAQVQIRDNQTNNTTTASCSAQIANLSSPFASYAPIQITNAITNQNGCFGCGNPAPIVQPVQCPSGTIEKSRSGNQIICETQNTVTITTPSPTPTPTIVPTQVTVVTANQPVQCPSGTIEKSRSSAQIICERQVAGVTTEAAQSKADLLIQSQATNPSVKELPKTGLPLAAASLVGLTPIGLRIKRLLKPGSREESANELWMQREMQR